MSWLLELWGKTKLYVLIAAGAIAAAFAAYWRIREEGKNAVRIEHAKARDRLQEHYDEIDRQEIDPASSYDRLRRMSADKDRR